MINFDDKKFNSGNVREEEGSSLDMAMENNTAPNPSLTPVGRELEVGKQLPLEKAAEERIFSR